MTGPTHRIDGRRTLTAGVLLGVGLGGLFDGIVLHQVLQWHHLLSTPTPPTTLERLELNTLADGAFHVAAWIVTVLGIVVLATAGGIPRVGPARSLVASGALTGWGLFNLIEGIVDHHILELHHVRPGPDAWLYDIGFLAWGAAMLLAGVALGRRARRTDGGSARWTR